MTAEVGDRELDGDESNASPLTRSEKMKALWRDPEWRAAMLAKRSTSEASRKRSEAARRMWQDPSFRRKMRESRVGMPR